MTSADDNTVRYYYEKALLEGYKSLQIYIEFLLIEKEVISLDDDISVFDFYMKPNNKTRMNKLLKEYRGRR